MATAEILSVEEKHEGPGAIDLLQAAIGPSVIEDFGETDYEEVAGMNNIDMNMVAGTKVVKMKKRSGGHLSSKRKQKARKKNPGQDFFEKEFGSISDYGQDAWNKLSQEVVNELSKTVVGVASYMGNEMYFGCTGIVVKSNKAGAHILTTASVVKSMVDGKNMKSVLSVRVRLPNNEVTGGRVALYDLDYNIAVIRIPPFTGFRTASFDVPKEFGMDSKLVAVGRWFYSGKFMAMTGVLNAQPIGVCPEHLRISTCKISMVMTGGPLIDLDGHFVGMNFYSKERTPFLPSYKIFDLLMLKGVIEHEDQELSSESSYEGSWLSEIKHKVKRKWERPLNPLLCNSEGTSSDEDESEEFMDRELLLFPECRNTWPDDEFWRHVRNDLQPLGYCMPTRLESGMRLVNHFEEEFVEDTWCKLSNKIASNIRRTVVSLASFKGKERFFACTGTIIDFNESTSRILTSASLIRDSADENKIDDELEIKVYLPNKQQAIGTLQHYNLTYNVAVVSITGFRCLRTVKFNTEEPTKYQRVVAVGRIFKSGKLMTTSGVLADKKSELDCKDLMVSTCKITKAGIGGPLLDVDGNFVGMNFYGKKETHFLPCDVILQLLKHFERKWAVTAEATDSKPNRAVTGEAMDSKPNRWPVHVPRWSYPSSRPVRRRRPRQG